MPEGHTIHRLAADLGRDLVGESLAASSPQGRFLDVERIDGKVLRRTEAVGKHLFLHFAGGGVVHVHLGLFGRFYRRKNPAPQPRDTTRLRLEATAVTWDLVGPTRCERLTPAALKELRARLGADPLAATTGDAKERRASLESAWKRFHATKRPVGAVLLDQRVVSGIGNVYRAELLFLLRLHPATRACDIERKTFDALWKKAGELLARGVAEKRIVTVPHEGKKRVKRADALYVYKRRACRECGGAIVTSVIGGRRMYACETCQPQKKT
jgi:endonuclease-8